ncbi:putative MFS family arabinose efflux permease [Prosthecobacter fusiformis]|uniref:Putative MFS family arabinose efflux permease n=1 Tax=Prosthecobacter fusiformis TaxID=48464 RepID=A0A4R7RNA9_9BACT|nr:MFS transporter [Prosthecobacter fusiformis]TDU66215.1 putative MFS family arabinose efflux permease [Prosthecobacter fusiformis]
MSSSRPPISEKALLILLAAVQFAHIMDFMVMMPLGPQLMRELNIGPERFSGMVAAYTFAAGIVGLLAAPFMDRFDRRKLLLFCFAGFILGTLACALSHTAEALTQARIVCGAFGGVSGALIMAIVSDVVPPVRRAAGMGIIMTAFSVAAALGVPLGLYLAQAFSWETPFFVIVGMGVITWIALWYYLPPIRDHLNTSSTLRGQAFWALLRNGNAGWALLFIFMLVIGHMIMIPLLSPYLVHNLGLPEKYLSFVYLIGGCLTLFTSPWVGRLADRLGRIQVLGIMIIVAAAVVLTITNAPPLPIAAILTLSGLFFIFASGRFVPAQAIGSLAVPPAQRGAFMSLNTCVRDIGGGVAASLAGYIVTTAPSGEMVNFHRIGYVAVAASALSYWLGTRVRTQDITPPAPLVS